MAAQMLRPSKQIVKTYGWEPSISLRDGLEKTYGWIYDQLSSRS